MADSKLADDAKHSLMLAGASYKVKCRKTHGGPNGEIRKIRLRPADLGCHPNNRGGEYPSGLRVQELLKSSAVGGILQAEADHNCVVVEEMRLDEMLKRTDYQTALTYNAEHCAKDALLHGLYGEPFNHVAYSMLAHNHFMTVVRAFLIKALWKLPPIS